MQEISFATLEPFRFCECTGRVVGGWFLTVLIPGASWHQHRWDGTREEFNLFARSEQVKAEKRFESKAEEWDRINGG